ncbi:Chitinase A1 [Escovopsis weberi]|uniref:chitinase n=1 Tax=Escovopsis weberi TaxID=150374 RepID=A0A0M8N3J8_ESCWE|nr:Chitinase A1 [Escovopsis weberi]
MRTSLLALAAAAATGAVAKPRFVMYFDQWHKDVLPDKTLTAGVTHVITAFAGTTLFNSGEQYTPFMPLEQVRALFDPDVKVCMAIGGWGDTAGFSAGAATNETRQTYAKNIAATLDRLGYDCVDIDWEYPGGNGQDYRQTPNDQKVSEIETYPLLLAEVKKAIGDKELSIAVPGREEDMIAFTPEQVPKIDSIVDYVNVMTYDLMNRRMNKTEHHTSVQGSNNTISIYLERGMTASKMNLGFAFYAKFFDTKEGVVCTTPTGCDTAVLELPDGSDPGLSGAITFEVANWSGDLVNALQNGQADKEKGGQWYWDATKHVFWTWDTPEFVAQKFADIIEARGLGGAMAWSLAQDSHDWSLFKALKSGIESLPATSGSPQSNSSSPEFAVLYW